MNKRVIFSIILLLIIGIFIYLYLTKPDLFKKVEDVDKSSSIQTTVQSDFRLESKYIGNSKWEYTVTGQLPNPCYTAVVDALVAESYPEQVTITVVTKEPEPDMMCAQVIQDFKYNGTFSASEKAEINLAVK
ncbi:MAG: hypothetical protein RBS01_03715 [Candidatus Dojkabacteria bacterium]|jgi:hypothetical protein|nr:hypothetical protein [Candidatus Dojkabacteria bacterium]